MFLEELVGKKMKFVNSTRYGKSKPLNQLLPIYYKLVDLVYFFGLYITYSLFVQASLLKTMAKQNASLQKQHLNYMLAYLNNG